MSDSDSIKTLGRSIASLGLLMASSRYSVRGISMLSLDTGSCADAARWAAVVTLLAGVYYLQFNIWRRCRRRKHRHIVVSSLTGREEPGANAAYTDVPQTPPPSEAGSEVQGQAMTASHVYIYVYGWGLLLFASLYCMAGLHESSSCWWALGMFTLCFDELIMRETRKEWVLMIGALFVCSVVSVWWDAGGESAKDENFGQVIISTVLPVMSPFIFFSLRSSVRAVTRDAWRLYELALPFMLLISICVLTGSYMTESKRWSGGGARRALNQTVSFKETLSEFDFNRSAAVIHAASSAWENEAGHRAYLVGLFALTPVIAAWCIHIMVWSVVMGYVTEFISAFLLVLSVKSSVFGEHSGGPTILAVASAGTCFILIFLMRKVI
jgi:hypothetical protein